MPTKYKELHTRIIKNFSESDKYRNEIHELIPGGAHTYSKGDDQFPQNSPAAILKGKGAYVWDIDGNQFLDCSMGLTSVTLGHAFEPVLARVREELEKGVNFQRPSIVEKEMAKAFLELVPVHDMIKFAKNGSIVTTAAVKLARAHTGRKLVAFPSDHPFYSYDDWFIGKTACDKGIPDSISELSVTFKSNDLESISQLFEKYPNQIACVITEPEKNFDGDTSSFLREAIELVHKHGALFILDEMITGFKTDFPGSITKYNLEPDMATWGKSIANGFSFCALTGTREVMELGAINRPGKEKVFLISTTHGGETHALGAGIATIDFYKKNDVIGKNHGVGKKLIDLSRSAINERGLQDFVQVSDTVWMQIFVFRDANHEVSAGMRTLIMQEMIKRGVLFQGAFVPSFSHSDEDVLYFVKCLYESLSVYKDALIIGYKQYLKGPEAKPVFRKLV
jgi:glutamate-1-semialdehyde aminotransferase